jgi:hypothetical protein
MLVYYMVFILTHFWLTLVPRWGILKLLGDYRYLSIMKPLIIDNSPNATLRFQKKFPQIFFKKCFLKKKSNFFFQIMPKLLRM